jgi:hypothetical protein
MHSNSLLYVIIWHMLNTHYYITYTAFILTHHDSGLGGGGRRWVAVRCCLRTVSIQGNNFDGGDGRGGGQGKVIVGSPGQKRTQIHGRTDRQVMNLTESGLEGGQKARRFPHHGEHLGPGTGLSVVDGGDGHPAHLIRGGMLNGELAPTCQWAEIRP